MYLLVPFLHFKKGSCHPTCIICCSYVILFSICVTMSVCVASCIIKDTGVSVCSHTCCCTELKNDTEDVQSNVKKKQNVKLIVKYDHWQTFSQILQKKKKLKPHT